MLMYGIPRTQDSSAAIELSIVKISSLSADKALIFYFQNEKAGQCPA